MPRAKQAGEYGIRWWCPGCGCNHVVPVTELGAPGGTDRPGAPDGWEFNGDFDLPTLSPSVLVNGTRGTATEDWNWAHPRCHSFVRDGRIEYLSDCEHELAGQTVDIPEISVNEA